MFDAHSIDSPEDSRFRFFPADLLCPVTAPEPANFSSFAAGFCGVCFPAATKLFCASDVLSEAVLCCAVRDVMSEAVLCCAVRDVMSEAVLCCAVRDVMSEAVLCCAVRDVLPEGGVAKSEEAADEAGLVRLPGCEAGGENTAGESAGGLGLEPACDIR